MIYEAVLSERDKRVMKDFSGKETQSAVRTNSKRLVGLWSEIESLCNDSEDIRVRSEGKQTTYFVFEKGKKEIYVYVSLQPYITKPSWKKLVNESGKNGIVCMLCNLNKAASSWNGKNALIMESGLVEKALDDENLSTVDKSNTDLFILRKNILNEAGVKSISLSDYTSERYPYDALAGLLMDEIKDRFQEV